MLTIAANSEEHIDWAASSKEGGKLKNKLRQVISGCQKTEGRLRDIYSRL